MSQEREAIKLILERLKTEGLEWYRHAKGADFDIFQRRISGNFSIFDGIEHTALPRKPEGRLPPRKILVMRPSGREQEEILGMWLRWNFNKDPIEFRLFIGQWAKINGSKTFIAFRFDTPEVGNKHDYFHCQPCRNFGEKELVPDAALISEHFPTIPINASNIVELTMCALMACMGHNKVKKFIKKLLLSASDNSSLRSAFLRCCH